ncbi:MAG: NUDIX domain-containing protein [Treponema sp.]|nr:NUDIX domain-containing protein [Candidatus Treponema merdequi]
MKKSVACIAYHNQKVLIAHRNPVGQMGSRFEFPGGKVDDGESEEQAIKREMSEEFGIDVSIIEKITTGYFSHNGKESSLEVYLIKVSHDGMTEKYRLTEHTDYRWVDIDDIPKDNFVDSDLSIYPEVKKYLKTLQEKN